MATFTVTINDADVTTVATAICANNNYQATLPDGTPNPVDPVSYARLVIINFMREQLLLWAQTGQLDA